ncbi:MAG: hypothetical protein XU08_C0001G0114 [candidate division WWE3 bacterium CSP1-7]|uniref:Uncharacterized protein n=1 Tax=candidate division WWE3 bacterium CSP1-7 TaxID=1576480 RepID=A0A0T5ZY26_UNCKA|nr:MAG: hypothetical protein XU08_C0001G0114 [candidate division WWE3 bacterium CSP1-7]
MILTVAKLDFFCYYLFVNAQAFHKDSRQQSAGGFSGYGWLVLITR